MLGNIGFGEWGLIFLVVLLLFGAKRVPEIARSFGQSINEFKKGLRAATESFETPNHATTPQVGAGADKKNAE